MNKYTVYSLFSSGHSGCRKSTACRGIILSLVILVIYLLPTIPLSGQDYRVRHYAQEIGLENEMVKSVAIDSLGFLWIGTSGGLFRYNGNDFVDYTKSFESQSVTSVLCKR
nr:hypothetical protein [Bacteroidota bacterium]